MYSCRFCRVLPFLSIGFVVALFFCVAVAAEVTGGKPSDVKSNLESSLRVLPAHASPVDSTLPDGEDREQAWVRQVDPQTARNRCVKCHEGSVNGIVKDPDHVLNHRLDIPREQWAAEINLSSRCGTCHTLVQPEQVPSDRWMDVLEHMLYVVKVRSWPQEFSSPEWMDILHYYITGSSDFEKLPPDPLPSPKMPFVTSELGPMYVDDPKVGNVNIVDLDKNGKPDVLVADIDRKALILFSRNDTGWVEKRIAGALAPAKTEVFDFNGDKKLDIALAYLGSMLPTDEAVGGATLLLNAGEGKFNSYPLIGGTGRLADIRPADFDNDGDIDFVLAAYGFLTIGEIGWLEQLPHPGGNKDSLKFEYHRLSPKAGGIHVIPTDLNGDKLMDVVALIAQEHEEIIAFINQGKGEFKQQLIYKAFTPSFGSSGIELVDMDKDGDQDVLYTNGDAVDLPSPMILPYHGVQWLENKGNLEFAYHSVFNFYGAYRALPGDLDNDGDLDIVAVTMLSDFEDSTRMSAIWLENDGKQNFTPHGMGNAPINLITMDLADMDNDGDLDMVTGAMNVFMFAKGRMGRVTLWENKGEFGKKGGKGKGGKKKGK